MRSRTILTLAALGALALDASATNVTDWGPLGPIPSVAVVSYTGDQSPIDDVYTFSIGALSDVDAYGEEFEARSVSIADATFALYSGTWGDPDATLVGTAFSFTNEYTETLYSGLEAGDYYFRIQGSIPRTGAAYDFEAYADNAVPPSGVPEPGNLSLLLAGVALMGFLGLRRRQ